MCCSQEKAKKKPTAGSLDGSGWRDLQALLIAWFEWLAVILVRVEFDGFGSKVFWMLTLL